MSGNKFAEAAEYHVDVPKAWAVSKASDRIVRIGELAPGPRCFLYGTCFIRQKLTVLGGGGGMMKSTFAIGLCLGMAAGVTTFGMEPREGALRTLYVSTEDELDEVHRLLRAAANLRGISSFRDQDQFLALGHEDLPDNFSLIAIDPKTREAAVNEPHMRHIEELARLHCSDVIVLDPLYGVTGGVELTPEAMNLVSRRIIKLAQATNSAVLVVHHTRKANGLRGIVSADELTGGKPLVNAARAVLTVREPTKDEGSDWGLSEKDLRKVRVVDAVKINVAPSGGRWFFKGAEVMHDDNAGGRYGVQAADHWSPPTTTRGFNPGIWFKVAEIVENEFVLDSDKAPGNKLKDVVARACSEDFETCGVGHDPKSFLKEIRDRRLVEIREERNPDSASRSKVKRAVLTEEGRKLLRNPTFDRKEPS